MTEGMNVDWKVYVDTLYAGLEKALTAKDLRDEQRFQGQGEALTEAKTTQSAEMKSLIDKIDLLSTRAGGSVPRSEMDALLAGAASSRHSEIADAVGSVVKQFTTDLGRLTRAVEEQGEQFNKAIMSQNEQRGTELKRLTDKVEGIESGVSDLNAIQLQRQGRSSGVSWTGKTVVSVVGVAVSIIVILGFLLAHPWRP